MHYNRIMLGGNLTRDPELRFTPAGVGIATLGLAVNTNLGKTEKGEKRIETLFVDVVAFGKQAEVINEYFRKGDPIFIEGRLRYRTWEDSNGNKKGKHEVLLERFEFIKSAKDGNNGNGQAFEDVNMPVNNSDDIPF